MIRRLIRKFAKPATLKKWIELGDIRKKIEEGKDADKYLCSYLTFALGKYRWDKLAWIDFVEDFVFAVELNQPKQDFPIFSVKKKGNESTKYETPTWYIWGNVIAKAYGWTLEYIADLDVETGIGLIQEILYDEQSEKEYLWNISDRSVGYNKDSKQSYLIPYEMPEWMRPPRETVFEEPKKVKIKKGMLPMGPITTYESIKGNVKH